MPIKIPIYFHNFEGYDSHFLVKNLHVVKERLNGYNFKVIASNTERFKKITIDMFEFMDSFAMLPSSLDSLVSSLRTESNCDFKILDQMPIWKEKNLDKQQFKQLLLRKGIFCYEWLSNVEKLKEKKLPKKKCFFSKLTNSGVTDEEYEYAKLVFKTFKCESMHDYLTLYQETDTYLLAEVLFSFRKEIFKDFELDAFQYLSLPQLSFDCMLKKTSVKLELLTDLDQVLFVESGLRGGMSFVNTRHAKNTWAKQQEKTSQVSESEKKFTDIRTIDANALYTWCQMQPLPVSNYKWLSKEEIDVIKWDEQDLNQSTGYIVECTLKYPKKLHKKTNAFPLAPLHIDINYKDLSPFAKKCKSVLDNKKSYKARKLSSTFATRENYVCHYMNLKFYLSMGMELVSVRRVISFKQEKFLEPFMNYCADQRKLATSEFRKANFKLIANSIYGKFIECTRNYIDCKLALTDKTMTKWMNNPRFKKFHMLDENAAFCYLSQTNVLMNKCYPIGFTILELSKFLMFQTFYNKIRPVFPSADLIFTDTDSFALQFQVKRNENVMEKLSAIMDFSNYPKTHPLHNDKHKGVPGYFKDEAPGNTIKEIVAIRSKVYCMRFKKGKEKKTLKGVKRAYKQVIPFKSFKNCVNKIDSVKVTQYAIRSKSHNITTQKMNRLCFSSFDDKRYLWQCAIHSSPYSSYLIKKYENKKKCPFCY